jgi:hypothetical protein
LKGNRHQEMPGKIKQKPEKRYLARLTVTTGLVSLALFLRPFSSPGLVE